LALSEPDRVGPAARDIAIQRENATFYFPHDMSSAQRAIEPGVLDREPLRWRSVTAPNVGSRAKAQLATIAIKCPDGVIDRIR
jgi:hypothetical protein